MNLNLIQICGRLTKEPELRATQNGTNVLKISVATNRVWKGQVNEKNEETEFHNVVAFGKTAENIAKYFGKGDEIYIQGRLKTSSWEDQSGIKKYRTEIMTEKFDFGQKSKNKQASQENKEHSIYEINEQIEEEIDINSIPF